MLLDFTDLGKKNYAVTPASQVGEISKSSTIRTHHKLWVCFFNRELEGTDADAGNVTSAQHRFANPRIILQGKAVIRLHYTIHYDPTYIRTYLHDI